ncbi:MAG: M20/M25/M40 family metallo-hydrolase [Actinomycetota bacterium]|nr:M20/M25/M40 family metallo-hydrolase [Acidimicrobiia bacterium]MDQ3470267.1 M20/M25/M40 family metallo-hydrolase [Actinomycetota bacterium]
MTSYSVETRTTLDEYIDAAWAEDILPALCTYITIPNVSAHFDPEWEANGHMEAAVKLVRDWCAARPIAGLTVDVQRLPGRSPLVVCEVPASDPALAERTVLLYGHLDKQPEMTGWRDGLGPWTPVVESDRLYGRGGADDGYAAFASLLAIEAAQAHGIAHARCVVLIEASEESGSPDLPAHLVALADRLGSPELVLCLDSGCLDDERLWVTTSLRGLAGGTLTVQVLTEGVHSGEASGVAPSSFRLLRLILERLEDSATGKVRLPELHVDVPDDRRQQAHATAAEMPHPVAADLPFAGTTRPMVEDPAEQLLARTWRPTLSYIGVAGLPPPGRAGNVLRPSTSLTLSFRLPPTCDHTMALEAIQRTILADPPEGATVRFDDALSGPGWNAPSFAPWLDAALDEASRASFGQPARRFGEGGSIPFMGMLGEIFPAAQFVVTGVLGPGSNAHGPNEFLHLPTARRVTACLARLLGAHAASPAAG